MKKITLSLLALSSFVLVCFVFFALNGDAQAQSQGGFQGQTQNPSGGFVGPGLDVSTAKSAASMRDDSYVVLKGKIIRSMGHEKYQFQDNSGTITVDIDDRKWNGITVSPNDVVEIQGEIDKDWNSVEVDVDRISLAK
jgi:uncharacterized protein (TIGR00156 family)